MTGMKPMKRFYYRAYQTVFDLGSRVLPWRKPEIVSGAGSTARIPELLRGCGVKKVMIVSGKHTGAALVPPIRAQIKAAGISAVHFDAVRANPTISIIEQVRERYLAEGCDGLLAVGGGSPMDTAKAAAARIVRPNCTVEQMTGLFKVMHALPPFIAVPTTAGSGSETTIAAVITNEKTHHKHAIMDLCLVPRFAVLDAVLTEDLPPATTAQTGMDALTHAVEAYVSVYSTTKETDRCAEEATAAIFRYLERAYANGHDLEARQEMLLASFKAASPSPARASETSTRLPIRSAGCIIRRTDWQTLSFSPSFWRITAQRRRKSSPALPRSPERKRPAPHTRRARRSSPRSAP